MLAVSALILAGCAHWPVGADAIVPTPAAAAAAAERAGMTGPDIARAADLYVAKCANCHRFYDPAAYADAEWHRWMAKMVRKSKLDERETELLTRYLAASR
jgi:nitrate/TMAO reductase-like tetraheme cytochrome c subunit